MVIGGSRDLTHALDGSPDVGAIRAVEVLDAHAAALAWLRQTTGTFPAPAGVAARLQIAADLLLSTTDGRDPRDVLVQVAASAVDESRPGAV